MSLGTSLSLSKDSATDVDTNVSAFDLRAADLNKSEYSVAGLTPPAEKLLTVSHETGKSGEARHLVRLDRTEVDAYGVPATVSTYVVQVRPPSTALTNAICIEEVNKLVDFIIEGGSNANWTKILNSEV
jgi:hypothetical protein